MKETEKIHEFKTATRHLRERTRFPLLLKQPENMQGCGQRHLNVRKKQKKKTLSFLEENKIKGKSANMIQFKSRDKARIKHDKARLRWSHAPFVRLDRPQRDRLRLLAFFWQLHHGVRFWRRFHSKRRLDLNLFIMDECLLKEWSLVIASGGRGIRGFLVVSG